MNIFMDYTKKQKYYAIVFILGFMLKYNFFFVKIFNIPSLTGLVLKNIIIILFIASFVFPLIKNNKGREYIFWFSFFFSIFFLFNIWYNRYFGNYLSLSDILMGQGFRPFKVLLRQLLRVSDFIFIIDIIILGIYRAKEKSTTRIKKIFMIQDIRQRLLILLLIVVILFSQIYITNNILGNRKPLVLYKESTSDFINVYGILPLYFYEFYTNYLFSEKEIVKDELVPPPEEELSGEKVVKEDHNIIVIQVESLDKNIIDYKYNDKEVTPFLNRLKSDSLYADNFYAQHINGSFDAEFSFLTSIYPVNKNYGFKINDLSEFDSLVRRLNKKGYETMAFHGNDKDFFHRHKAFPELGFDKFYSKEDFSFEDREVKMSTSIFGLNDYDFFLQSFDYIKKAEQPFFAFLITVTSHTPFDTYPQEYAVKEFNEINNPLVRDYFNSISFVDRSLKLFFNKLKAADLDKNTMVIIYSDHEAGIEKKEYSSKKEFITDINIKTPENIPLFIIYPNLEEGKIEKEGTPTDLAPTILDILGEEKKPEEFLGNSLINEKRTPVLFLNEIPTILYKDQLFVRQSNGIEKIGYSKEIGKKDIELPNQEEIITLIEYMRGIIFKRRID